MYDEHRTEDMVIGGHPQDHAAEEMRYFAVMAPNLSAPVRSIDEPIGVASYRSGVIERVEDDAPFMTWDEWEALQRRR